MIPPVMNRPMFNQAQPQLQAPQMSMNPQAQQIQMFVNLMVHLRMDC